MIESFGASNVQHVEKTTILADEHWKGGVKRPAPQHDGQPSKSHKPNALTRAEIKQIRLARDSVIKGRMRKRPEVGFQAGNSTRKKKFQKEMMFFEEALKYKDSTNVIDKSISPNDKDIPQYVQDHCDLTGVDYWMVPENDWRRQFKFLIIGEKKSGTTGLFQTLNSHPQVIEGIRKEFIFFNPKKFKFWENDKIGGRVKVAEARRALFLKIRQKLLRENRTLITGEGTPEYLLYPDICDKSILCTSKFAIGKYSHFSFYVC